MKKRWILWSAAFVAPAIFYWVWVVGQRLDREFAGVGNHQGHQAEEAVNRALGNTINFHIDREPGAAPYADCTSIRRVWWPWRATMVCRVFSVVQPKAQAEVLRALAEYRESQRALHLRIQSVTVNFYEKETRKVAGSNAEETLIRSQELP
jgi:hypothetical protein